MRSKEAGAAACRGTLVVSLDFELHWGVRDTRPLSTYGANILGARTAVPAILRLFERHGIHATWAVVGFLLCRDRDELLASVPSVLPAYDNMAFSPYSDLATIGRDERDDPYHYAPSLVRAILDTPGQELATHTLSHYYCLERGGTRGAFIADLKAAMQLSAQYGAAVRSIVFPRNQYGMDHLRACRELGIVAYRGNPQHAIYRPSARDRQSAPIRLWRLADSYLPVVRHASRVQSSGSDVPVDVPATRFLRPWSRYLRAGGGLPVHRILDEMTEAAREGRLYHLWWHPHNFGLHPEENLRALERVLEHAARLKDSHGLRCLTMDEAAASAGVN